VKKTGRAVAPRPPPKQTRKEKQKMNPRKLMAVALYAAACVTTTAFADDDFGIESASPVRIADPVNPQPGMVMNIYPCDTWSMGWENLQKIFSGLATAPAEKTGVSKSENFSIPNQTQTKLGRWEGYLKCKRATTYTFVVNGQGKNESWDGFSLMVNGKTMIKLAYAKEPVDVDLKLGWNKIEFVAIFGSKKPVEIEYKPKGSLSEPRSLGPKDFFYDQKPDDVW